MFVIDGEVELAGDALATDHLAVLSRHARVRVTARRPTRLLVIGGPPVGPRLIEWNFVASTPERIAAARDAWRTQRFPKIPTDDQEFIPLPEPG